MGYEKNQTSENRRRISLYPHLYLEYKTFNKKAERLGQVRIRIEFGKCVTKWFHYLFLSGQKTSEAREREAQDGRLRISKILKIYYERHY